MKLTRRPASFSDPDAVADSRSTAHSASRTGSRRIRGLLGREPNDFELAVFSLLWSEHCGYKHSALLLKRLPSAGKRVLQGPGENAGVLDLGGGEAVAFKVESHNHPSAVEPFQGAATGVGGILRDVIAMGARPVALLDGLRFAEPGWMFERAVEGIGHYGNCVGVPTVGGEAVFDEAYSGNCLVNAMCVGLLPSERVTRARATLNGGLIVLYGATTGRDGIGGASVLASQELGEPSLATAVEGHDGSAGVARLRDGDKRPSVQIGDTRSPARSDRGEPRARRGRGWSSRCRTAAPRGLRPRSPRWRATAPGVDVELDRVPLREEDMEPWEIMISRARMAGCRLRPGRLGQVEAICEKWELAHAVIGEVTETGELRAFFDRELVGDIPAELLTDECPRYRPEGAAKETTPAPVEESNLTSRRWIYQRYDQLVGSRTVRRPGLDAAVIRLGGDRGWPSPGRTACREAGSFRGCTGCLGRRPQRRLRRRRADRPHRLPQLREPGKPEIAWELEERSRHRASGRGPRHPGCQCTCPSTTTPTDARSRRHPSSLRRVVADVRRVPQGWRRGDMVAWFVLSGTGRLLAWSRVDALVWRAAARLSLAHDVSTRPRGRPP